MSLKKKGFFPILVGAVVIIIFALILLAFSNKKGTKKEVEKQATATPQDAATPTPTPDVETAQVEKNVHQDVNDIVNKYFEYSIKGDVDNLNKIISDAENVTKDALHRKYEYIEDVKNIDCYTLPGADDNSYVVYVFYKYKFVNINTLAPGMSRFYVCTGSDGSLRILLNNVDDVVKGVLDRSENNQGIKDLKQSVQTQYEEALTKDAELKKFVETLNKSAEQASATKAPKATAKPKKKDKK